MRALSQGTTAPRDRGVAGGARVDDGARSRRRAARIAHLISRAGRARCVGVLLAGGAARRFGGHPKGLAAIGGIRIADLALGALRKAADELLVVANDPRAPSWFPDLLVICDETPGLGPLAGIASALDGANGASVLVVAWDMPFVTSELLRRLRERGDAGASAVVPRHGETVEPLCAWYAASAYTTCRELLTRGERRAAALVETLPGSLYIDIDAEGSLGDPQRLFTSVDTPEQLRSLGGSEIEAD